MSTSQGLPQGLPSGKSTNSKRCTPHSSTISLAYPTMTVFMPAASIVASVQSRRSGVRRVKVERGERCRRRPLASMLRSEARPVRASAFRCSPSVLLRNTGSANRHVLPRHVLLGAPAADRFPDRRCGSLLVLMISLLRVARPRCSVQLTAWWLSAASLVPPVRCLYHPYTALRHIGLFSREKGTSLIARPTIRSFVTVSFVVLAALVDVAHITPLSYALCHRSRSSSLSSATFVAWRALFAGCAWLASAVALGVSGVFVRIVFVALVPLLRRPLAVSRPFPRFRRGVPLPLFFLPFRRLVFFSLLPALSLLVSLPLALSFSLTFPFPLPASLSSLSFHLFPLQPLAFPLSFPLLSFLLSFFLFLFFSLLPLSQFFQAVRRLRCFDALRPAHPLHRAQDYKESQVARCYCDGMDINFAPPAELVDLAARTKAFVMTRSCPTRRTRAGRRTGRPTSCGSS